MTEPEGPGRLHLAGRPVTHDVSAGAWISGALRPGRPPTLASLMPPVFAAYARVLHPAVRYVGEDDVDVAWAAVAAHNGRTAHRLMQWAAITGSWDYVNDDDQPGLWNDSPAEGHLPVGVALRLAGVLARHTATPEDCWFGLARDALPGAEEVPVLHAGDREHLLLRGPLSLGATNLVPEPAEQGPSLWWPADRAWCVVTDIDLMSTYVGGSPAAVADLLAAGLEVHPAEPADPVLPDSDRVNPPPD